MKYVALWIVVFAAISLTVGGVGLILQWVATDPSRIWLVVVIAAAALIACIAASVDYLSDQPRTSKDVKQAAIEAARTRDIG